MMAGVAIDDAPRPGVGRGGSRSALAALADLRLAALAADRAPVETGFDPLDDVLGRGVRPGDLVVVGGKPGVGKTIAALQWARHMASLGTACVFACYEHDEATLLARMLTADLAEAAAAAGCDDRVRLEGLRRALRAVAAGDVGLQTVLGWDPLLAEAEDRFATAADRLALVSASGTRTGVAELHAAVERHGTGRSVLFVDYVQKIPPPPATAHVGDSARVRLVTDELKELALARGVAVVALAATGRAGLEARRVQLNHVRGAEALAYEADVALVLNAKFDIVARAHLAYDTTRAASFRSRTVFTVEKNRHGAADIDLEFRKDFANYRFDPRGTYVAERLWAPGSMEE